MSVRTGQGRNVWGLGTGLQARMVAEALPEIASFPMKSFDYKQPRRATPKQRGSACKLLRESPAPRSSEDYPPPFS